MGIQDQNYVECKDRHDSGFWSAVAEKGFADPSAVKNVMWRDKKTGRYCLLRPITRLPDSSASLNDFWRMEISAWSLLNGLANYGWDVYLAFVNENGQAVARRRISRRLSRGIERSWDKTRRSVLLRPGTAVEGDEP